MGIQGFFFSEHKFHGSFHCVSASVSVISENNEARKLGPRRSERSCAMEVNLNTCGRPSILITVTVVSRHLSTVICSSH